MSKELEKLPVKRLDSYVSDSIEKQSSDVKHFYPSQSKVINNQTESKYHWSSFKYDE